MIKRLRSLNLGECAADGNGFHGFRRTFADLLQRADVSELPAAKIIGHGVRTLTYGLYAGDLPLEYKARIMRQCINYASQPAF